jgi:AGCS family alanine or glycine:cation symporter
VIDTIVVSTASAVIILLAGDFATRPASDGNQLMQHAMIALTGTWGAGFVAFVILLFALTSIVVNYLYAENNLVFLRLHNKRNVWLLRVATLTMVMAGSLVSLPVVWQIADVVMALMALINLTALLLLSPVVTIIASDYLRQRKLGIRPVFDPKRYPEIERQLAPGAWDDVPRE